MPKNYQPREGKKLLSRRQRRDGGNQVDMNELNPKLSELDANLARQMKDIVNKQNCLLMSFIAPKPVKTSPVDSDYATITVDDIYNIERSIEVLTDKSELPSKLHLVVNTPGGSTYATTKIARYLRGLFQNIDVFVPYEASSGGTVFCLAANSIVMGNLANLTPIDPQTVYKDEVVSAVSFEQAVEELHRDFSKLRPAQIPSPYQQLISELDPIFLKEKSKLVIDVILVAWDLLEKSQNPKTPEIESDKVKLAAWENRNKELLEIAKRLTRSFWPHSHLIGIEEAKEIGLNVSSEQEKLALLKVYKKWVSKRLEEPQISHIIECYVPDKQEVRVPTPQGIIQGSGDEATIKA